VCRRADKSLAKDGEMAHDSVIVALYFSCSLCHLIAMPNKRFSTRHLGPRVAQRIAEEILDRVGEIPLSTEPRRPNPGIRARVIARAAARQAAVTAGGLTLPPGPLGWLTLLPELRSLWRLQSQMVADVASCHGKTSDLGGEQMIYCLFRHTDVKTIRGQLARIGRQQVVQQASRPDLPALALKIGFHISQRLIGKGISRWVPVAGAFGAGIYAYYDTMQVANTAIELFSEVIDIEQEPFDIDGH